MKSKRILALMLGAIIASGSISQTAMQAYAEPEESSCSESGSTSEEFIEDSISSESESTSESYSESLEFTGLIKLQSIYTTRISDILEIEKNYANQIDLHNLYISDDRLIFEPLENNEAKLVCYDGNDLNVTVPQTIIIDSKEYTVTSIGNYAFSNLQVDDSLDYLAFVDLPNSITKIGKGAFKGCKNLNLYKLPESLTEIAPRTFQDCQSLDLSELPESLAKIGYYAFMGCTNLKLTKLPKNLTEIGQEAFCRCTNLSLTELPAGITKISQCAFASCENLKLSKLPENLTEIAPCAFYNCKNLKLTELPEKLTEIGNLAFRGCTNLSLTELPTDITKIGKGAFACCKNLKLSKLPESLTEIDDGAFCDTNIKQINIPASVTSLGEKSFEIEALDIFTVEKGSKLEHHNITTAFGKYKEKIVYYNDIYMSRRYFVKMVPTLKKMTSFSSKKIENILEYSKKYNDNINQNNLYISAYGFIFEPLPNNEAKLVYYDRTYLNDIIHSSYGYDSNITVPMAAFINQQEYTVTSIAPLAFSHTYYHTLYLPDSITKIGNAAFYSCENLNLSKLPESLTEIDECAFRGCTNLKLTELPAGITKIGRSAFAECTSLQLMALPDGITEIGDRAFLDAKIEQINIPASVTYLGESSFRTNTLRKITLEKGSQLNFNDIKSACGKYISQVAVEGIDIPSRPIYKTINNLDELIGQNGICQCPICLSNIIVGENVAEFPCTENVYHYMHRDCFETFVQVLIRSSSSTFQCPYCQKQYPI